MFSQYNKTQIVRSFSIHQTFHNPHVDASTEYLAIYIIYIAKPWYDIITQSYEGPCGVGALALYGRPM